MKEHDVTLEEILLEEGAATIEELLDKYDIEINFPNLTAPSNGLI